MEVFNRRWEALNADIQVTPDFDERDAFDGLLQEANSLADAEIDAVNDSSPRMSSTYTVYYVLSPETAKLALQSMTSNLSL
jgi:hypothetical protein